MATTSLTDIKYNAEGLIPAIIQDTASNRVLMLGYMNAESLEQTASSGRVVFWSRSRQELWRKGDTSGHIQLVRSIEVDCDADALLVRVEQVGPACHTGTRSCFDVSTLEATSNVEVKAVL